MAIIGKLYYLNKKPVKVVGTSQQKGKVVVSYRSGKVYEVYENNLKDL